jgi:hypothetical protein
MTNQHYISAPAAAAPAGAGGSEGESFYKGTDVVTLTDGNFQEEVMDSDDIWFVEVGVKAACRGVQGFAACWSRG